MEREREVERPCGMIYLPCAAYNHCFSGFTALVCSVMIIDVDSGGERTNCAETKQS